jgi:tetratricopeptide (TPR) repeat protein
MAYLDEIRFGYPVAPGSPPASLDRVSTAANRALELDPVNVRALQSKMLALYFGGQPEAALSIGERALTLNPNDSELMGEYGSRLAETANWDRGCGMVAQSLDRNLEPSGYYRTILAICAYIRADNDAAVKLIKSVTTDNPAYHLIAAAILAEAGDMNEALTERDWLLAHAPEFAANARNWAALRNIKPSDRDRFLTSLRKAGFELRRE